MSAPYPYNNSPSQAGIAATSPRRRQHPVQPPSLLTTSLGNARNAGLGIGNITHTPISTTSLSSPFSAYPPTAYPASPGGAMRGTSPMNFRTASSFNSAYNPQQWGLVNNVPSDSTAEDLRQTSQSSRGLTLAPRLVGPDGREAHALLEQRLTRTTIEPVASPPPPYSPRRNEEPQDSPRRPTDTLSPSDTMSTGTESSRHNTPVSAATTLSPDLLSRNPARPSTILRQQSSSGDSPSTSAGPSFPPPPSQRARPTSKHHADRLLSSLSLRGKNASAASPIDAIDALQERTAQLLARAPENVSAEISVRAPAARRAASTGAIGLLGGSSRSASHSPSPTTWEPSMPLPPPPPGPPPASSRSISLNRASESPSSGIAPTLPLRSRRPPGNGTSLETVPPTPADWRDENSPNNIPTMRDRSIGRSTLHIDTGSILQKRRSNTIDPYTATGVTPSQLRRDSSAGGLFRSPAVRNRSAMGIRERRSESRSGKGRAVENSAIEPSTTVAPWVEDSGSVRPTDLILPGSFSNPSKQGVGPKSTPQSGRSMQSLDGALNSVEIPITSGKAVSFVSSHSTPQAASTQSQHFSPASASTPLFSPGREIFSPTTVSNTTSPNLPPKALPTPPLRRIKEPPKRLSLVFPPEPEPRPVSHLLHMPNSDDSMQAPLTPATRAAQESLADLLGPESPMAFASRAIERHRIFAEREAGAANDSERLDLFVQFMIGESRIRRDQYAAVFEEEGIDIDDLTQDLFGQSNKQQNFHERQRIIPEEDNSKRTSIASSALAESSSQDDSSAISRKHESPSSFTTDSSLHHRPDSTYMKDYVPCLSPIASMSIVTGQDEMDSRGRAPSRWWEDRSHSSDAAQGDAFKVLERSKRESKYMGVPREVRNSSALYENGASGSANCGQRQSEAASHQPPLYCPEEYPPEKAGWHEEDRSIPPPPKHPPTPLSAPCTPNFQKLDVSRLVTLPPPYPRHHPAVNNSHPDLADARGVVRSLHEKEDADSIREHYRSQIVEKRQRADSWCKHQRSLHSQDIEFRIEHGEISQEQFDEAETELEIKIANSEKEVTQADFDLFQNTVVSPLHALFAERIKLATSSLDQLSSRLFSDAQSHSPNLPQEEGDEQPELLEKLTQLKWLFEAREALHRQTYDLLSERNDKYKAIILLPYKQTESHDKHADAESFFAKDAQERSLAFEQAVYSRTAAFLSVIENNVSRGVEAQLSAFWDIAPSLLEVLHKIPHQLDGFEVRIPADEYSENPSYYDHPLQYLYSLLGHAEKSTFQFIESQTNLLCLLHEIRSCALMARCRVEANEQGEMWAGDKEQRREETRLTEDLKEKVGVVEGQWHEALGVELMEVRERVREALLEEGGWDDEGEEV